MTDKCRAMVLTGPGRMEMQTFDIPSVGAEEGLLSVELAGVCGSDPGIFQGKETLGPRPYPFIMGHEIVGRIARMGASAQERHGVRPGDRVVIEYAFGCGDCPACRQGHYNLCEKHYNYGSMMSCREPPHLYGAYGDFLYIHPNARVHFLGDHISPETGVMICAVIANGVRWLAQIGRVSGGDTVAILGPGPQGMAGAAAAREAGARRVFLIGLDRDRQRLEMAGAFGCDDIINADKQDPLSVIERATDGKMADVVMDVTGNPDAADLALSLTGRHGTFVMPGLYKQGRIPINLDIAVTREIKLLGVFSHNTASVIPAIEIAASGRYPFEKLITHRFPLHEAEKAVRLVAGETGEERPMKVVIDPSASQASALGVAKS